jgi:hypothetical protein
MTDTLDNVVWIAPEALNKANGEFRLLEGTELVEGAERPVYGERVFWVNDAPGDVEDPTGHFEVYTGEDEDYQPVVKAEVEESTEEGSE